MKELFVSIFDIIVCLFGLFVFTGSVLFSNTYLQYLFIAFDIYAAIQLMRSVSDLIDNISLIRA